MSSPHLAISTGSWHFRYFKMIRNFYGCPIDKRTRTSLCPYVQTMIWGTFLCVLTLPLLLLGFLSYHLAFMPYCRTYGRSWTVDCEEYLHKHNKFRSLLAHGVVATISIVAALVPLTAAFVTVAGAMAGGRDLLLSICDALYVAAIYIGAMPVFIGHAFIFVVMNLGLFCYWIVGKGYGWLKSVLIEDGDLRSILQGIRFALIAIIFSTLGGAGAIYLFNRQDKRQVGKKIKLNCTSQKTIQTVETPSKPRLYDRIFAVTMSVAASLIVPSLICATGLCANLAHKAKPVFVSSIKQTASGTKVVMSPLRLMFELLWSLKKQACPMISFVDEEQTQQTTE